MAKYVSLSPAQARIIEEEAVAKYRESTAAETAPTLEEERPIRIKSVFPFHLFPDELSIDKDAVHYTIRWGPKMHQSNTILIDDIAQVSAEVGPILGQIRITPKLRTLEPLVIEKISRKDALAVEEVLERKIKEHHHTDESTY